MNVRLIFTIMLLTLVGGALSSWWFIGNIPWGNNVDVIAVNEIVKQAELHWEALDEADFSPGGGEEPDFAILNLHNELLYSTREDIATDVYEAMTRGDTIADVMVEGSLAGKVVIPNDSVSAIQATTRHLITMALIVFGLLAAMCISYMVYMIRKVIHPFQKLQYFAQQVARGHLHVPLGMERHNWFGAFSESFDLMREELAAARQSEYEANRSKKELVASLSHDIKTPLSSIKAVSELMLVSEMDDKRKKRLRTIHNKAEQIDLLVTDMFHATLEELDELTINVSEQYSAVLAEMVENVNYYNRIQCGDIPDAMILVDPRRLQQVFDNVISNAYKYAGTNVRIDYQLSGVYLEVCIMDDGPGVPDEEIPLLFNKFHRGSNAHGQAGSGLGLYISQYLMNRMEGDISCHNREDGFTVNLRIRLA